MHLSCDIGSAGGESGPGVPVRQGRSPRAGLRTDGTGPSPEHPREAVAGERPSYHVRSPVEAAGSRFGSNAGGVGTNSGQGTKTPHATGHGQKTKIK